MLQTLIILNAMWSTSILNIFLSFQMNVKTIANHLMWLWCFGLAVSGKIKTMILDYNIQESHVDRFKYR